MVYFKRLYCENGRNLSLSCQFLLLGKNEEGVVKDSICLYIQNLTIGTPRKLGLGTTCSRVNQEYDV